MSVYNLQSDKLLKINEIKDITSIGVYDIMNPKNFNSNVGILGLCVFCKDGRCFNYTQNEEEFVYFFETVRRVYESEKDNKNIYLDDNAKYFLNSFEPALELDNIKSKIGNVGTVNKKIYYNIKEVEMLYNILEYVLENFLSFLGRNVDIVDVKGIGSNFVLKMYENNVLKNLHFSFSKESDLKSICVFKGIIDGAKELYLEVSYEDGIEVTFYDSNKVIVGSHSFNRCSYTFVTELYINGERKLFNHDTLNKIDKDFQFLSGEENNFDKLVLPWGDVILLNESETLEDQLLSDRRDIELSENGLIVTKLEDAILSKKNVCNSFVYVSSNYNHVRVIRQNTIVKSLFGPNLFKLDKVSIKTCEEFSVTNYYVVADNCVVKESYFVPSLLGSGVYKSDLEGRFFYKVLSLNENELLEYNTVKEGVQGYQLLDENELKLILGRGVK